MNTKSTPFEAIIPEHASWCSIELTATLCSMSEPLKQALGATIREARRRAGLTQEELASRIGRATESVSNIERARQLPALDTLSDLAGALGVPMVELLSKVDEVHSITRQRAQLEARLREIGRSLDDRALAVAVAQAEILLKAPTTK